MWRFVEIPWMLGDSREYFGRYLEILRMLRGAFMEALGGRNLHGQVSYLKQEFAEVLLRDDKYSEQGYNARLSALMGMLRARGTEVSSSERKFFSSASSLEPSPDKVASGQGPPQDRGAGAGPEQYCLTPPTRRERELQKEFDELKQTLEDRLRTSTPGRDMSDDVLARAIEAQTAALSAAFKTREHKASVVKITPTFKWPVLGDDGPDAKEVEEFFDKYEDLCRLANDGRGMNATEHLTTLLSCLRGSKEKVYKLAYKKHRKLGTVSTDPDKVFSRDQDVLDEV